MIAVLESNRMQMSNQAGCDRPATRRGNEKKKKRLSAASLRLGQTKALCLGSISEESLHSLYNTAMQHDRIQANWLAGCLPMTNQMSKAV
jgi:hypothetical protein